MSSAIKLQYVSNEKGEVTAVQIPIEAWRAIEQKLESAEAQDWQGMSEEEITTVEAGLRDFEQGRAVTNDNLLERSRELRRKRA
ncbi:hypothetical protein [Pontibacter sp. HSC-36F09]|uniref:hypothetical protein n=1 Tax=Pontibacter sp. HSC-36F09 TaxID=2910966 RepID=UPI0020A2186C|nr:hypothetical protein [Pontibacter sp. HSC-36F09]MCP2042661.1 putative transcriptional regulator [Pontibacter sp. HSC-36F09]